MDALLSTFFSNGRLPFPDLPSPEVETYIFCQLWGDDGGGARVLDLLDDPKSHILDSRDLEGTGGENGVGRSEGEEDNPTPVVALGGRDTQEMMAITPDASTLLLWTVSGLSSSGNILEGTMGD